MVTWSDISSALAANALTVKALTIPVGDTEAVERFPYGGLKAISPSPPGTHTISPSPSPSTSVDSVPVLPTIPPPSAPRKERAEKPEKPALRSGPQVDPIVLGIKDPLYEGAPTHTRYQIECEEAQRIEKIVGDLYKSQGGRSRGWTKVGLEGLIRPRCATGGNLHELARMKVGFPWKVVAEDKLASAFLDFLCVAKQIRVAVWDAESKHVILFPAADYMGVESDSGAVLPLCHVNTKGEIQRGEIKDLVTYCGKEGWTLMPPMSIHHSLSGLTLAELESVGTKLGMVAVEGNKAQRVATVAIYKLRQRLLCLGK